MFWGSGEGGCALTPDYYTVEKNITVPGIRGGQTTAAAKVKS